MILLFWFERYLSKIVKIEYSRTSAWQFSLKMGMSTAVTMDKGICLSYAHAQTPTCTAVYQFKWVEQGVVYPSGISDPTCLWNQGVRIIDVLHYTHTHTQHTNTIASGWLFHLKWGEMGFRHRPNNYVHVMLSSPSGDLLWTAAVWLSAVSRPVWALPSLPRACGQWVLGGLS